MTASPQALKSEITGNALKNFDGYLRSGRKFLEGHADFDAFVDRLTDLEMDAEDGTPKPGDANQLKIYKKVGKLIAEARREIQVVLWRHQVFLSTNIIDRIIFELASNPAVTDIPTEFFNFVLSRQLHETGFVLYPIHSFGIQGFGYAGLFTGAIPDVVFPDAGVMICAQTNNETKTLAFLNRVRANFGITQTIPSDFEYEFNRDVLKWMKNNPLMAVKISSTTSGYYENQLVIMVKLKLAAALIQMLAALGRTDRADPEAHNLSTARANNWQTLDIHHYIVFEAGAGRQELQVLRTPMNLSRAELASLSEVNVDVDPREWGKDDNKEILDRTKNAIDVLEKEYFANWILGNRRDTKARVLRKIYLSVGYFHRSFRSAQQMDEAVVALAIAFETLLTDGFQRGGVKARVARRVKLCLLGESDAENLGNDVQRLMERRGAVVHEGASDIDFDLNAARRAFVLCFFRVIGKIDEIKNGVSQPVGDLLGDLPPKRTLWDQLLDRVEAMIGKLRSKQGYS